MAPLGAASIAAEVLKAPVTGIAIGVARGGDVVYGFSDVAAEAPLMLEDVHQIASLTKEFTAAAVMRLVEQGPRTSVRCA